MRSNNRIGFGVDGGDIERVVSAAYAQKAGGLFECLGAEARHGAQFDSRFEAALFVAELDDFQGGPFGDAGDVTEQCKGGGVEIDSHSVDAAFDSRLKGVVKFALIDVVLVLANADGFRIDLDQFGKRVLQTAGDGYSAADG